MSKHTGAIELLVEFLREAVWKPAKVPLGVASLVIVFGLMIYFREIIGMVLAAIFFGVALLGCIWIMKGWVDHIRESWRKAKERVSD